MVSLLAVAAIKSDYDIVDGFFPLHLSAKVSGGEARKGMHSCPKDKSTQNDPAFIA